MASRKSIETADFLEIAQQLLSGRLMVDSDCRLEISSSIWHPASDEERAAFLDACAAKGIEFEFVQQIGGAFVVCD